MCSKRLLALAGVAASILWVSAANAVTVSIGLQQAGVNSGNISTVASGINTTAIFAGGYGTFTANAITANGSPPLAGSDLLGTTSSNISSGSAGVLSVWITAQNITSPISSAMSFISSFTENTLSGAISSVAEFDVLGSGQWPLGDDNTLKLEIIFGDWHRRFGVFIRKYGGGALFDN